MSYDLLRETITGTKNLFQDYRNLDTSDSSYLISLVWKGTLYIANFGDSRLMIDTEVDSFLMFVINDDKYVDFECKLEENENINFIKVHLVKMVLVCLFICHYGGCMFYFIATLHANPEGTCTVRFGDLHPVALLEKIFSIVFLFHNVGVIAYVATNIGNLYAPDIGPTGRYMIASRGDLANVEFLLGIGDDPNGKDLDAKVPLWYALLGGHESVIQALERGGATGLGL
ncbi:potassium channel AKT1 [Trifolium repens]|nr:potassium channel AKT1 [Trifolium repens]